ncbi:MAG: DegV family protein [Chloroflexi bacterium]|nr:DegV family protein [Chloroflexota bacterium]
MKAAFAIVSDSGHNLPPDLRRRLTFEEVPFTINFGVDGSVDDGVLELEEFATLLDRYEKGMGYPTTSAPPPARYVEAFERCLAKGQRNILAITMSSRLSLSFDSAVQAAHIVKERHPRAAIEVADSRAGGIGEGFLVLEAGEAQKKGLKLEQAKALMEEARGRLRFLATFETTKYLVKSGRARSIQHLLVSALKIRPLVSLRDGAITLFGRVRGQMEKAIDRIVDEVAGVRRMGRIAVAEGIAPDLRDCLLEKLLARLPVRREQVMLSRISPVIMVHTGKRCVGVFWEELG